MSSDGEQSDASSEANDLVTTGLIATRAKRSTAGNLYASLRANLDDEELQKDLLAEDEEEDAADYEGSDKGDDEDEALESSSEEDDAGPPQEGQAEDLAGETELKKVERKEQRQKRKAKDARLKLPAWQQKKKVKLADDVKTEDGAPVERPKKKKSERSNWLPTADDAPTRQSRRSLAVASREVTHANLQQSYERSEKQRRVMKVAAEREKTKKRANLTQEERMKVCEKIERQTAKEFGRWEREEAERQKVRDEILAAKRLRGLEGPVLRMWSGSAVWAGPRMVEGRCEHGSQDVTAKSEPPITGLVVSETNAGKALDVTIDGRDRATSNPSISSLAGPRSSKAATPQPQAGDVPGQPPSLATNCGTSLTPARDPIAILQMMPQSQASVPWLHGIHDYALQTAPTLPASISTTQQASQADRFLPVHGVQLANTMSYPQQALVDPSSVLQASEQHFHIPGVQPPFHHQPQPLYNGWPPQGTPLVSSQVQQATPASPVPPPPLPGPVLREQAQRSLVILEQFEELVVSGTGKRSIKAAGTTLEPTVPASILLPESYPAFGTEESKYLLAKFKRSRGEYIMAPAPSKQLCAITSWVARYRDPKTGLCYADMHIYKIIQRMLAGGYQWSGLLGCWTGPAYGPMGRPARGVPEGFAGPPVSAALAKERTVKVESAT